MDENRIRGRVTIEFTQGPNGEVQPSIYVDDWILNWADQHIDIMAIAWVPEAVIAARVLADMCRATGIERALKYAAQAVKGAKVMRESADTGKSMPDDESEEQGSSIH
jgi:hypothetical protein